LDDVNKRIYKRLYHNLPYLLKSKGTIQGLKTLLNIYGIPDTILRISEFGGKDKVNEMIGIIGIINLITFWSCNLRVVY
jgi:hypothetical protein